LTIAGVIFSLYKTFKKVATSEQKNVSDELKAYSKKMKEKLEVILK